MNLMSKTKQHDDQQIQQDPLQELDRAAAEHEMLGSQAFVEYAIRQEADLQTESRSHGEQLERLGLLEFRGQKNLIIEQRMEQQFEREMWRQQRAQWDTQPKLEHDAAMMEKKNKKKKDQEHDASQRAEREGLAYTSAQEVLIQSVTDHKEGLKARTAERQNKALENIPDDSWGTDPFDEILKNGGSSETFGKLLRQHEDLAAYLKRAPKELTEPDAAIILEHKRDLFQKLDDAVRTYYAANGVNMASGKRLSASKQAKARQHLALAMENCREAFRNREDGLGEVMLNALRKDKDYQRTLKEETQRDADDSAEKNLPAGVLVRNGSDECETLTRIYEKVSENPEKYQANKEQINRLFAELTNCANTMSSLTRQREVSEGKLVTHHQGEQSAAALNAFFTGTYTKRYKVVQKQLARLERAITVLLTEEEPVDLDDVLFLHERCGYDTEGYKKLVLVAQNYQNQAQQLLEQAEQATLENATETEEQHVKPLEQAKQVFEQAKQATENATEREEQHVKALEQAKQVLEQAEQALKQATLENATETEEQHLKILKKHLSKGKLSGQVLACGQVEAQAKRTVFERQFRAKHGIGKGSDYKGVTKVFFGFSLLTTPISKAKQGAKPDDDALEQQMLRYYQNLSKVGNLTYGVPALQEAMETEVTRAINEANWNGTRPLLDEHGNRLENKLQLKDMYDHDIPIDLNCVARYKELLTQMMKSKNGDPTTINTARELHAYLALELDKLNEEEGKQGREQTRDLTYFTPEPLSTDMEEHLLPFREEIALCREVREDLEAFVAENPDIFKAYCSPLERMEALDTIRQLEEKASAVARRYNVFNNSPFFGCLSEEEQKQFDEHYVFFRSIQEYWKLNVKIIDALGQAGDKPPKLEQEIADKMDLSFDEFSKAFMDKYLQ